MDPELQKLIEDGQWETALPKLKEYLSKDLAPEEKGRLYAVIAEKYMDAVTDLNEKESAMLGQAIEMLQSLEKKESRVDEDAGLAAARAVLK